MEASQAAPGVPAEGTVGAEAEHEGRGLRSNALNIAGSIVIAFGSAAPTASIVLTLSAIVAVQGYASPIGILLSGIPMLGIALAYRRLNMWEVNCGTTYVWAGRAISPYFGFMVGWVIILAYFLGAMSIVLPIGTYALLIVDNSYQDSATAQALVDSIALVFITYTAYIGIRATARLEWLLLAVEYLAITILAGFGLVAVFGGNSLSSSFDWSWFSWGTLGGVGGFVSGALIAVYMFSGWDTSVLVNEETEDPKKNSGNAVVISVIGLAVVFAFYTFAFQGALKPGLLQKHGENALFYMANQLGGSWLAKWIVLAVTLSAVGSVLACLVSGARVMFAMGHDRVLPPIFGKAHTRHRTPHVATFLGAAIAFVALWGYYKGSSSVVDLYDTVVGTVGLLFAVFYAATGIAMVVFYRRLAARGPRNAFEFLIFPGGSAFFLCFIIWKSVPDLGGWTGRSMVYLYILLAVGVALMLYSRIRRTSDYFDRPREAYDPPQATA